MVAFDQGVEGPRLAVERLGNESLIVHPGKYPGSRRNVTGNVPSAVLVRRADPFDVDRGLEGQVVSGAGLAVEACGASPRSPLHAA